MFTLIFELADLTELCEQGAILSWNLVHLEESIN